MRSLKHAVPAAPGLVVVAVAVAVWIGDHGASTRPDPDRQGLAAERAVPAAAAFEGTREQVLEAYAHLPLAFVENRGQTDPSVSYFAQGLALRLPSHARGDRALVREGIGRTRPAGEERRFL